MVMISPGVGSTVVASSSSYSVEHLSQLIQISFVILINFLLKEYKLTLGNMIFLNSSYKELAPFILLKTIS